MFEVIEKSFLYRFQSILVSTVASVHWNQTGTRTALSVKDSHRLRLNMSRRSTFGYKNSFWKHFKIAFLLFVLGTASEPLNTKWSAIVWREHKCRIILGELPLCTGPLAANDSLQTTYGWQCGPPILQQPFGADFWLNLFSAEPAAI